MWRALDDSGQLVYPDFVRTVMAILPMYWFRVLGGALYLLGVLLGAYNFYRTWKTRPAKYEEPVHEAPALVGEYEDEPAATSRLGSGVADLAHKIDRLSQGRWHRRWERLPVRFTVYVVIAVVVASLFEIIPTFVIRSNVPTISTVTPYTPLELVGRDIYVSEGCYNCHSQMIRPIISETKRYGEYSKAGEFVYDHPFQWGSRRIGPDLAREGVVRPQAYWHALHFRNPSQVTPDSIMPPYPWFFEKEIDLESIPVRIGAMQALGVPYTDAQREASGRDAVLQAMLIAEEIEADNGGPLYGSDGQPIVLADEDSVTEVVAMIAYMKRLGTDLFVTPDATEVLEAEVDTDLQPIPPETR